MITERPKITERGRYSPTQVAKALGISTRQVYRLTDRGLLPYTISKVNNRRIYSGKSILKLWENY